MGDFIEAAQQEQSRVSGPHPYKDAPPYRMWRRAVSETDGGDVDPVVRMPFRLSATDRIVTAGSCFAQHIAERLRQQGFAFLVTESAHPILPPKVAQDFQYGLFSARYGNLYTARQLLQLMQRAYGAFTPRDDVWEEGGRFYDPFRPQIQPGGFATLEEYQHDRAQHFAAVRRAFEEADIFVFTLGLTECWVSREDGAAYPVCPGTAAGRFEPARHVFVNFGVEEVVADMTAFLTELRRRNPRVKMILTVSPVPLAATAEDRHVLVSTTYSKAVLRIAAEQLTQLTDVAYFPSYEIVTGAFSRGAYFGPDLRSVTKAGVDHVMRLFFAHAAEGGVPRAQAPEPERDAVVAAAEALIAVQCEEEALDPGLRRG
jgi:hypothetical protein